MFNTLGLNLQSVPHSEFNPSLYPQTYRTPPDRLFVWTPLAGLLTISAGFGAWYYWTGKGTAGPKEAIPLVLLCALVALMAGYVFLLTVRSRLILHADAIEIRSILAQRTMARDEIGGWQILPVRRIPTLELTPSEAGSKKLAFALTIKVNDAFYAWFTGIPDLDYQKLRNSRRAESGETDEQFASRLTRAKAIAMSAALVAIVGLVWVIYFFPSWLLTLLLMALPAISIFLMRRSPELYDLGNGKARATLAVSFYVPGVALALQSFNYHFLDWEQLLAWAACLSIVAALFVARFDQRLKETGLEGLVIFVLIVCFAFGALASTDASLDRSSPHLFETKVLAKTFHTSRRSTTWYLRVIPTGPITGESEISVPHSFYDSVSQGQTVCIALSAGALRLPWYEIRACR